MKKIIGSQNDREIRRLAGLLDPVAEHENDYRELSNRDFQENTVEGNLHDFRAFPHIKESIQTAAQ